MTRDEAIEHGKEQLEIFGGQHQEFIRMAIRSLEAWDKVRESLDRLDRLYITTEAQVIRVYPKWNVDKIIEQHLKEVKE